MKTAWGLIVVAADLLQFGGLVFVGADTCESPGITCTGGTGAIAPTPTVTCSADTCTNTECCVADETCADYTGGCTLSSVGPALEDVVCSGACDEDTCCISHCPTGTTYDGSAGSCDGACDTTGGPCCPANTCGTSFDYTPDNACASTEGPALPSTLCSTGTNGCDGDLCCVPHESCSAFNVSVCEHPLNLDEDDYCDGACDSTSWVNEWNCCDQNACATDFHPEDCTTEGGVYDDTAVCGSFFACDESTCCFSGAMGSFSGAFEFAAFGVVAATAAPALAGLRAF